MSEMFDDEPKEDPKIVDELLSKELMNMTLSDRNAIQEEIHGVHCLAPTETPSLLQESLSKLDNELGQINPNRKKAYLQCQQLKETYVNGEDFRLRFLRCELFDTKKAANRIVRFLDYLKDLFGDYALERPIRLSDFSREELKYMRRGRHQYLPFRDRSGRRIFIAFPGNELESIPPRIKAKIALYTCWTAGNDIDAQQKGLVTIVWFDRSFKVSSKPQELHAKFHELASLRPTAIHLCTPDTPLYRFRRSVVAMRIAHNRSKLRIHLGNTVELSYILQGYGIPTDTIPITFSGTVKINAQRQWMRLRQFVEEPNHILSGESASVIECPYLNDIVFRQGTNACSHPGNATFRAMIAAKYQEFWKLRHGESQKNINTRMLIESIIEETRKKQLRILIWNDKKGCWNVLTDDSQIYLKIEYLVRDHRASTRAQLNRQMNQSSTSIFCSSNGNKGQNLVLGEDKLKTLPLNYNIQIDNAGAGFFESCLSNLASENPSMQGTPW